MLESGLSYSSTIISLRRQRCAWTARPIGTSGPRSPGPSGLFARSSDRAAPGRADQGLDRGGGGPLRPPGRPHAADRGPSGVVSRSSCPAFRRRGRLRQGEVWWSLFRRRVFGAEGRAAAAASAAPRRAAGGALASSIVYRAGGRDDGQVRLARRPLTSGRDQLAARRPETQLLGGHPALVLRIGGGRRTGRSPHGRGATPGGTAGRRRTAALRRRVRSYRAASATAGTGSEWWCASTASRRWSATRSTRRPGSSGTCASAPCSPGTGRTAARRCPSTSAWTSAPGHHGSASSTSRRPVQAGATWARTCAATGGDWLFPPCSA